MTKMSMPEMRAVRFIESDVIVASGEGPSYMRVSGLYDGPNGSPVSITFDGTSYLLNEDLGKFTSAFSSANRVNIDENSSILIRNSQSPTPTTLNQLITWDHFELVGTDIFNGVYYWDFENKVFKQ